MNYSSLDDRELIREADWALLRLEKLDAPTRDLITELANRLWDALYKLRTGEAHGTNPRG